MKRRNSTKDLDPTTYGDSKAEINLARIVTEQATRGERAFVGRVLGGVDRLLGSIKTVEPRSRYLLIKLIREHFKSRINEYFKDRERDVIKTHLENALIKRIRNSYDH